MFPDFFRRAVLTTLSSIFLLTAAGSIAEAQRLPGNVVPSHYQLVIDPNIETREFSGEETITLQVTQATSEIVLNSLDLEITLAEVTAGGTTQPAQVSYDKPNEMVRLSVEQAIPAGAAKLHVKFSSKLTEGLRGLYLSKSGRRSYAVTQFEGTYARMMFPSFDEPGFKATFDLAVLADKCDTAISNGRIISDEPTPTAGRHKLTFSTSPKMSTYLVALAIGDWQCLERTTDGVPIRVCAVPERKALGQFALDVASHSIQFYNQWYGIKYPFGKLDMVAIPDYEWGGMENTASIFYRDSALLLNEATASVFSKRGHATVIAHEIAHQWFGDLVTAAWWDDIWLNEGFATWMERKPIEAWHPEWRLEDDEAASAQQVISLDSLGAARAIHGEPKTSAEIKEMFDGITYEKGGAVLRMLESYLGAETFRKGVNVYLQAHANGNATSADFWQAEAQVSGKPVDKIMPTYVMQPGVPVISLSGSCHVDFIPLQVEQQRFYLSPESASSRPEQQWQIPVCIKGAHGWGSACSLVKEKKDAISINGCPEWFMANRDAKGYYRVSYDDPRNLLKTAEAAAKELNVAERIALVEDAWAMTRVGKYPVGVFLHAVQAMRSERERRVIEFIADHMDYIGDSLVPPNKQTEYRAFVQAQFGPLARELGWKAGATDTDDKKALRASLLGILGSAGDPGAIAAAREMVQQYLRRPSSVEGTIAGPALTVAAENGDASLYDQLSGTPGGGYLFTLAAFRQPALIKRTLEMVDQGKVRQQDYARLFPELLAGPGREIAWDYLKAHWDDLAEKVTSFGGRGAVPALGNFCSESMRDDVKKFFTDHRAPGAERALQQSLERMNNCIEFKQLQQTNMQQWLAAQGQ